MSLNCMFDYHIHPDYSIDADGSVLEYCQAALDRGLSEICFTTHFDTEPEAYATDARVKARGQLYAVDGAWLPLYFEDIDAAARTFGPRGLTVRAGIEIGYHPDVAQKYGAWLGRWPFDFVLGSVHRIGGLAVTIPADLEQMYAAHGRTTTLVAYFNSLRDAANSGMFDCLGHIDVYRRTAHLDSESDLDDGPVYEAACEFLFAAARNGVGIEINARDGEYGAKYLCPGPALLRLAVASGVRTFTIGSDSHGPEVIGVGGAVARRALLDAGVLDVATFSRRSPTYHRLSDRAADGAGMATPSGRKADGLALGQVAGGQKE